MDKNKLYVVKNVGADNMLPEGTLVKVMKEEGNGFFVQDLKLVPSFDDGRWWIKQNMVVELKHKFNIGDRVMTIDGLFGAGTVIFVGTMAAFDLSGSINEPCYIVKLDERKSSYLPFFHKGKNKYFKGMKENVCYYFTDFELSKLEDKQTKKATKKVAEKPKFKVGDKIVCCQGGYRITGRNVVSEVVAKASYDYGSDILVRPVARLYLTNDVDKMCEQERAILLGKTYEVNSKFFKLCDEAEIKKVTEEFLENSIDEKTVLIFRNDNIVTAVWNGKKGIAKCSPEDKFDFFVGANIALMRCLKGVK